MPGRHSGDAPRPEATREVTHHGDGSVITGGSHYGDTYIANLGIPREMAEWLKTLLPPEIGPAKRASIAEGYLGFIHERYRYLEFKGMGLNVSLPLRMPLLELYVPLKARRTLPEGDAWSDELRVAGRRLGDEERAALFDNGRGGLSEPEPILDLLAAQEGLVILGDPGSGKSTLLKRSRTSTPTSADAGTASSSPAASSAMRRYGPAPPHLKAPPLRAGGECRTQETLALG